MYPENPEGTRVIVGFMNMRYVSDTVRIRTRNLWFQFFSQLHYKNASDLSMEEEHLFGVLNVKILKLQGLKSSAGKSRILFMFAFNFFQSEMCLRLKIKVCGNFILFNLVLICRHLLHRWSRHFRAFLHESQDQSCVEQHRTSVERGEQPLLSLATNETHIFVNFSTVYNDMW